MIFEAQSYFLIMWDAVCSMAVGFVTGFVYQLLSVFLYRNKLAIFIRDVLICMVFTLLVFSYVVSFANYKVLRWYNIAFAAAGWWAFPFAFSSVCNTVTTKLIGRIKQAAVSRVKLVCGKLSVITEKKTEKTENITQKNQAELLKHSEVMLYN